MVIWSRHEDAEGFRPAYQALGDGGGYLHLHGGSVLEARFQGAGNTRVDRVSIGCA
jgi:hypothetical protein